MIAMNSMSAYGTLIPLWVLHACYFVTMLTRPELLLTLKKQMDRHFGGSKSVMKLCINLVFIVLTKPAVFEAVFWLNGLSREDTKVAKEYSKLFRN